MSWIFISAPFIAILFMLLAHAYGNLRNLEDNWSAYRCNPLYMPFAGLVDDKTGTAGNFQYCMNLMGKNIMAPITDALESQFAIIYEALEAIGNPLSIFRVMLTTIRKFVLSFATSTLGKATGPVSTFVYYLNKIQDVIRRMVGSGYLAAFFSVSAVSFLESFISLMLSIIKGFVYAMLIIAVILALFQPEILAVVLVLASALSAAGV
jgi:hypothetical protein